MMNEKGRERRYHMISDNIRMKHVSWIWLEIEMGLMRIRYSESEARATDEAKDTSAVLVLCQNPQNELLLKPASLNSYSTNSHFLCPR